MKTKGRIAVGLLMLTIGIPTLFAQSKKDKKEQQKEIVGQLVTSGNYKIDVLTAMPMSGNLIMLSTPYSLEIKNDSVVSYLPYFGRAYNIPYGGGDGLHFKAPLKEYTMKTDRKGNADIRFTTRSTEDYFEFNVKIFSDGSSDIHVNIQNRQSINFSGELSMKEVQ